MFHCHIQSEAVTGYQSCTTESNGTNESEVAACLDKWLNTNGGGTAFGINQF